MPDEKNEKWLAEQIKKKDVAIFSGAGLSTESGLLDFRSKDGIGLTPTRQSWRQLGCWNAVMTTFWRSTKPVSTCLTACSPILDTNW